jgi:TPR repeat protein
VRADVHPAAPPSPIATEAEARHLMARARRFVEQRNISAAREMFERAADAGHPPALFGLAETYDPNMLAAWETIGTQGDVARAKALYAKALYAGMAEAQARLKALTQASGGDTR